MKQKRLKNIGTFLIFGGPSLIAFIAVAIVPLVFGLYLTFTNWNMSTGTHAFVGLANYVQVFTNQSYISQLWFTLKYAFFTVILSNVGAFLLGLF